MTDVDQQIARTNAFLDRTRDRYAAVSKRERARRGREFAGRLSRVAAADIALVIGAMVFGWFIPLGMGGALVVMALLIAATLLFALLPVTAEPRAEKLAEAPIRSLPLSTERWLEAQRPALPAPARTLADSIGARLETLAPQLATLDEREPAAAEIRKLLGEQLPELVKGYARVPEPLRGVDHNGRTPDQQLVEGLKLIDEEIDEMSAKLAQGDMDLLATRSRYLQIRYGDENMGSAPGAH